MYAVFKTGGKQYRVQPGETLRVEKLPGETGDTVEFPDVLLLGTDAGVQVGTPTVARAKVVAEIVEQGRAAKVVVFKFKAKTRYRRRRGHRQHLTTLNIKQIVEPGKRARSGRRRASAKTATKAAAPTAAETDAGAATKPDADTDAAGDGGED